MSKGEQALNCLMGLNKLEENGYTSIIKNDVGPEILGVFEQYCKGLAPQADANFLNTLVHLMITGYLVKSNEGGALSATAPKIVKP